MALVELGLVEQRYKAVCEVLDGATVTDVAMRNGVVRQTVHDWLRRYAADGIAGLADRTSKPATCPHQMPPVVEARVLEMRRFHPGWGPRRSEPAHSRGHEPLPDAPGYYRALVRHHLIKPARGAVRPAGTGRWTPCGWSCIRWTSPAVCIWPMFRGPRSSRHGAAAHAFAYTPRWSRATAKPVCRCAFRGAMEAHGVPEAILTDNGKVTGRSGPGRGSILFNQIYKDTNAPPARCTPSPTETKRQGGALPQDAEEAGRPDLRLH